MTDCVYLGESDRCYLHERVCSGSCRNRLQLDDPGLVSKWSDPLLVTDRNRKRVSCLKDLLAGASAFLVCGGPSASRLPLESLVQRGIWSLAVNNMGGHPRFRPSAFVCADPPKKFSSSIWMDPGIMKFVPTIKLKGSRANLRIKRNGEFGKLERRTYKCPNVWGFQRHSWMSPDHRFFTSDGACWGNHKAGSGKTGQPRTVCTMLLGIRLLKYLGAKRTYLVGADFMMAPDYGYAFDQKRTPEASGSNNHQFSIVNRWLCEMQQNGTFARFGMEVFNCFQQSGLRAFPFVPFEQALADCRGEVEEKPDLAGWYE